MIDNKILKLSGAIQLRGGTQENLSLINPLLANREIMVEIDTGRLKIGDGVSRWNQLNYSGGSTSFPANDDNVYAIRNSEWVQITESGAAIPVEVNFPITIKSSHISQKYVTLPYANDSSRLINVFLNGILTEQGTDWILSNNNIFWSGLELDGLIQTGDKLTINYYRRQN